ncbi:thioredoxin [Patescibacteria group bacterium]|nr:thioredoxin [Patescibacteria group bacterium]MBU1703416.1 thioredoxin [Patescibacteria group bacterium]MBU1953867.1 thioredoxin [Patescibacteria group bacterium]
MAEVTFTDDNFEAEVNKSKLPVLVDFFAPWCGPCKMMAPTIDKLADEYKGKIKIGKLDVDDNNAMSTKFEIQSIPTLIFFKDGKVVNKMMGFQSEEQLKKELDALLG